MPSDITHDPDALFQARAWIRMAYIRVRQLRQEDPTIRVVADQLDEICVDLTTEIDGWQPRLALKP